MAFNVNIEKGAGLFFLKAKIPVSLYFSWRRALLKPGREGLSAVGIREGPGGHEGQVRKGWRKGNEWGPWPLVLKNTIVTDMVTRV